MPRCFFFPTNVITYTSVWIEMRCATASHGIYLLSDETGKMAPGMADLKGLPKKCSPTHSCFRKVISRCCCTSSGQKLLCVAIDPYADRTRYFLLLVFRVIDANANILKKRRSPFSSWGALCTFTPHNLAASFLFIILNCCPHFHYGNKSNPTTTSACVPGWKKT